MRTILAPAICIIASELSLAALLAAAAPQAPPNWTNYNATWDLICQAQGSDVAPGSAAALAWGTPPYAGTTGEHPTYGYRHTHILKPLAPAALNKALRAIFSADFARHCTYSGPGAKIRQGGYDFAMRPIGWKPELWNDAATGGTVWSYGGSNVEYKNLDEQHCWSFLFDVARIPGVSVPLLPSVPGYATIDASLLARARLMMETQSISGIMRQPWYQTPHPGVDEFNDRIYALPIGWVSRAFQLHVFDTQDADAVVGFLNSASKFYGMPPGVSTMTKAQPGNTIPPVPPGVPYFIPAQSAWAGAALFDAAEIVESEMPQLALTLRAESKRLGRWAADSLYPDGKMPWCVTLSPTIMAGSGGKPLDSIAAYLGPNDRHDPGFDAGAWAYRAMRCSAALGDSVAAAGAAQVLAKWSSDPTQWTWLVDENWQYMVAAAKTAAGE
jgi:hypothetical protein